MGDTSGSPSTPCDHDGKKKKRVDWASAAAATLPDGGQHVSELLALPRKSGKKAAKAEPAADASVEPGAAALQEPAKLASGAGDAASAEQVATASEKPVTTPTKHGGQADAVNALPEDVKAIYETSSKALGAKASYSAVRAHARDLLEGGQNRDTVVLLGAALGHTLRFGFKCVQVGMHLI